MSDTMKRAFLASIVAVLLAVGPACAFDSAIVAGQMPALTGDCTTSAGTVATTCNKTTGTTTNDNATAGNVGEFVSSAIVAGSAVALTTITQANVTSISLTAGDWDVWINAAFTGAATTTMNYARASISTTSATVSGLPGPTQSTMIVYGQTPFNFNINHFVVNVGPARLSLNATTTVYFVVDALFAVSTASAYGTISARRRR